MDLYLILTTVLQVLLTGGVGGVLIVGYATKGVFIRDEALRDDEPRFASDYDELMWLAERQKRHLSHEETQRFFELRQEWTEMHSSPTTGNVRSRVGTFALSV